MIDFNSTDDEQIAALKAAWQEHGRAIVTGIVLGIGIIGGWNYWKGFKLTRAQQGSELYAQAETAVGSNDIAALKQSVSALEADYSATPYLALGQLALAKAQAESGNYAEAEAALRAVIADAKYAETRDLAKLRLASVLNAAGQHQQALDTLSGQLAVAYSGLADEHRGDALHGLGQVDAARAAYDRALDSTPNAEFLRWKRDTLGDATSASDNAADAS